jgi:hypothetical protein
MTDLVDNTDDADEVNKVPSPRLDGVVFKKADITVVQFDNRFRAFSSLNGYMEVFPFDTDNKLQIYNIVLDTIDRQLKGRIKPKANILLENEYAKVEKAKVGKTTVFVVENARTGGKTRFDLEEDAIARATTIAENCIKFDKMCEEDEEDEKEEDEDGAEDGNEKTPSNDKSSRTEPQDRIKDTKTSFENASTCDMYSSMF